MKVLHSEILFGDSSGSIYGDIMFVKDNIIHYILYGEYYTRPRDFDNLPENGYRNPNIIDDNTIFIYKRSDEIVKTNGLFNIPGYGTYYIFDDKVIHNSALRQNIITNNLNVVNRL